jgi:hypothetical protein
VIEKAKTLVAKEKIGEFKNEEHRCHTRPISSICNVEGRVCG